MNLKGLEERRQRRLAGQERVSYRPAAKPARREAASKPTECEWSRAAVLSGMATYSDETLAELFWIGDKMERTRNHESIWDRNGKPLVKITVEDEQGPVMQCRISPAKLGEVGKFYSEHFASKDTIEPEYSI
jgi:hypothetical protein